jgi:hypothetical protein
MLLELALDVALLTLLLAGMGLFWAKYLSPDLEKDCLPVPDPL